MPDSKPEPFLQTVVHELASIPGLVGLDAGYEQGKWRAEQLADHVFEWLPEFALGYSEYATLNHADAVRKMRRAARTVYGTDKYNRRGEFGELLLHIVLRQVFGTLPAISKLFFKDSANDTVKGFDAVHVLVANDGSLELWLGEVKFYEDVHKAVADVVEELEKHTQVEYLKAEFAAILNKVDAQWPHAAKLNQLLSPNTSLDDVFAIACIPVLLTYDSKTLAAHSIKSAEFLTELDEELRGHHKLFCGKVGLPKVKVHLVLLPLSTKKVLVDVLHKRLETWQST